MTLIKECSPYKSRFSSIRGRPGGTLKYRGGQSYARPRLFARAIGLANLVALFDPEAVVVDSAPAPVGLALLQAAEAALKSSPRAQALARCVLLSPELGDAAPVLGAAAWARRTAV